MMKILENIKLRYRAYNYQHKNDSGGIAYINASIKKGQTVLDIGAHKAGYLYFMLKQVGKNGKVFAFEPQTNLYQYIIKIKKLFNWNNVTVEHLALSDSAGKVTLFIPVNTTSKNSSPGATILAQNNNNDFGLTEEISTQTLDFYCNLNNIKPDFLKIDVEGNELKVLQGGLATIKKYQPKIIVEIEARHVGKEQVIATFEFMKSLGYIGHFIHGINRKSLQDFDFEVHQNESDMKNYCNNFTFEIPL